MSEETILRVDPKYQDFITPISRFDKKKGAHVTRLYMRVDGRVQMAVDDAEEKGHSLRVETLFMEVGDNLLCRAEVTTFRGASTGYAQVQLGGTGVDETNPFENAETSAVGRALGFLGYGLLGGGIASADEMEFFKEKEPKENESRPTPDMTRPSTPQPVARPRSNSPLAATEKQCNYLLILLEKAGYSSPEAMAMIEDIREDRDSVSEMITSLKEGTHQKEPGISDADRVRKAFWAEARELMKMTGKTENMLRGYMGYWFGHESASDLAESERAQLLQWLGEPIDDDDIPDPKPPASFSAPESAKPELPDDIPETWEGVKLVCDHEGIPEEQMRGYLLGAYKKNDIHELHEAVIKRVINGLTKENTKAKFAEDVLAWKAAPMP